MALVITRTNAHVMSWSLDLSFALCYTIPMSLLAIDPGDVKSAFVVFQPRHTIVAKGIRSNERSAQHDSVLELCRNDRSDALAIEMIKSYGMAVGDTTFLTCVWIGRFLEAWTQANPGKPYFLIPRKTVAAHICGSVRARDSNVRAALIDIMGKPGTAACKGATYGIANDMWSAVAIAVTCYDKYLSPLG